MKLPIHVYGPETPATLIVPMALGLTEVIPENFMDEAEGRPSKTPVVTPPPPVEDTGLERQVSPRTEMATGINERHPHVIHHDWSAPLQMTENTQCFVFNLQ